MILGQYLMLVTLYRGLQLEFIEPLWMGLIEI